MMSAGRFTGWLLGVLALAAIGASTPALAPPGPVSAAAHGQKMKQAEVAERFQQAVVMLHARQFDHASTALSRVLDLAPRMPEAHVNMGYALLGLERPDAARRYFLAAIDLRAGQANAYYGLALADEMRRDYPSALGAMRAYLHLARADEPHRARARSALWEWEEKLGRHGRGPAQPGSRP